MSLLRYLSRNRKAMTTVPSHSLSGRDFVGPDETESSLTVAIGIGGKSKVATSDYSECLSGFTPVSYLFEFC